MDYMILMGYGVGWWLGYDYQLIPLHMGIYGGTWMDIAGYREGYGGGTQGELGITNPKPYFGLEQAEFTHTALIEVQPPACATLRLNRPEWDVIGVTPTFELPGIKFVCDCDVRRVLSGIRRGDDDGIVALLNSPYLRHKNTIVLDALFSDNKWCCILAAHNSPYNRARSSFSSPRCRMTVREKHKLNPIPLCLLQGIHYQIAYG